MNEIMIHLENFRKQILDNNLDIVLQNCDTYVTKSYQNSEIMEVIQKNSISKENYTKFIQNFLYCILISE